MSLERDRITGAAFDPEALKLGRMVHPDEDEEATARRIFREAVPAAAMQISYLATAGDSEKIRLDASKYVVERILGKPGDDPAHAPGSLLQTLVEGFEQELKKQTNPE